MTAAPGALDHAETPLLEERRPLARDEVLARGARAPKEAPRLAAAGVRRYTHNLEAPRALFPSIVTTHTYDDRVATARLAIDAGMELCCGGILGTGETLEQRIDFAFELAELDPCEVPINFLLPTGTPLRDQRRTLPREALQAIGPCPLI